MRAAMLLVGYAVVLACLGFHEKSPRWAVELVGTCVFKSVGLPGFKWWQTHDKDRFVRLEEGSRPVLGVLTASHLERDAFYHVGRVFGREFSSGPQTCLPPSCLGSSSSSGQYLRSVATFVPSLFASYTMWLTLPCSLRGVQSKPPIREQPLTMHIAAAVFLGIVNGLRALGIKTCALYVALADSDADLREPQGDMLGVVKSEAAAFRVLSSWCFHVWQQSKTRNETQTKIDAATRVHGLPLELPYGAWEICGGPSSTRTVTPLRRMNYILTHFDHLEEMLQDGPERPSRWPRWCLWKPKRLLNGTTKRRLPTTWPRSSVGHLRWSDFEEFGDMCEIFTNVWRLLALETPRGRPVLPGFTEKR